MTKSLTARAPAKLIISGEHSVLYAQPAIAIAINYYTSTTVSSRANLDFNFDFLQLNYSAGKTLTQLRDFISKLQDYYAEFLQKKRDISSVIAKPYELLQYAVANLILRSGLNAKGLNITIDSTIPLGCGMGSSAAALMATIYAIVSLYDLPWNAVEYLDFARTLENLQHGTSSGVDLHLVTYGGCLLFQNGVASKCMTPKMPLYIVDTGKPDSSTGQCVARVAPMFNSSRHLANDFGDITRQINAAISADNFTAFQTGLRQNHRLLRLIGVVPDKVCNFVAELEDNGAAAKICGSGAIIGDNAGIVLLATEDNLQSIASKYGYKMQKIEMDDHGLQIL